MDGQTLASLSVTHVHYNPHDPLSHLCAWLALLPQGLVIVYISLIYSTREIEILLTFAGQLACEALNWALKRYIKEERPQQMRGADGYVKTGYGMPSSHAQFVAFFAVSVGLWAWVRHSPSARASVRRQGARGEVRLLGTVANSTTGMAGEFQGSTEHANGMLDPPLSDAYRLQLHHPRLTHALLSLATLVTAILVAASRVYLSYHTTKQVMVGSLIGAVFAVAWFGMTEWARRAGWVERLLELEVVRMARIRDLLCEEDLVEVGWQVWEEKRRRRGVGSRENCLNKAK